MDKFVVASAAITAASQNEGLTLSPNFRLSPIHLSSGAATFEHC